MKLGLPQATPMNGSDLCGYMAQFLYFIVAHFLLQFVTIYSGL